jgi:hypothetical protein
VTGSWDRLVRGLLYFRPDDPVDSGGKKWLFTITKEKDLNQLGTKDQKTYIQSEA